LDSAELRGSVSLAFRIRLRSFDSAFNVPFAIVCLPLSVVSLVDYNAAMLRLSANMEIDGA
jgi:hypothetical protein